MSSWDLRSAIDLLYAAFAGYPLRESIESCPCCRHPGETRHLHTKTLRELTGDDLNLFTFRAMTTVGDVDDFRHFLPRILELLCDDFPVDPEVVLSKLSYGNWTEWPKAERDAVDAYLHALWRRAIQTPPDPALNGYSEVGRYLNAIARSTADLSAYLEEWERDTSPVATANLNQFLRDFAKEIDGTLELDGYWEGLTEQWKQIQDWAASKKIGRTS